MAREMTAKQLMNLPQYKGLSEEEVLAKYAETGNTFDKRLERLQKSMAEDYDLTDLNANDKASLEDLCKLYLRVEDLDKLISEEMNDEEPDFYNITNMNKTLTQWRDSISRIQIDLGITRKQRKGDNETSVVNAWESVKERAKKMLDQRLSYIYCEKCKMLLANTWFLYPEEGNNIVLTCGRTLTNGKKCGHRTIISSSALVENSNRNLTLKEQNLKNKGLLTPEEMEILPT